MGHYSDDYEYEALKREYRKECAKAVKAYPIYIKTLPRDTPVRFLHALEDLQNWLSRRL